MPCSKQYLLDKGVDKQRVFLLLHMLPTRRFFLQLLHKFQPGKALLVCLPHSPLCMFLAHIPEYLGRACSRVQLDSTM